MPICDSAIAEAPKLTPYQTLVVGLLAFLQSMVIVGYWIIAPLGAIIMPALAISPAEFGIVVSAYALSAGAAGLLAAGFAGHLNRKKLLLLLFAGFIAGMVWCGLAGTFATLLAGRIVSGLFGGVLGSVILAVATDRFRPGLSGRMMNVIQKASAASQVLSFPLGLHLSGGWTWQAPFLFLAAAGVAGGVVLSLWLQPVIGYRSEERRTDGLAPLFEGVCGPRSILGLSVGALSPLGAFLLIPFGSVFAANNLGVPIDILAIIYLSAGSASLAAGIIVGRATDSAGIWPVFLTGNALATAVTLIYTNLDGASLAMVTALNILMFVGIFACPPLFPAVAGTMPERQRRGSFHAFLAAVQHLAGGLAVLIAGNLVSSGPGAELLNFDVLGYALVAVAALTTAMAWKIHATKATRSQRS